MQIKNKNIIKFIIFLSFFILGSSVSADEFNITANEILIEKDNQVLIGKGSVTALDKEGRIIKANKIT